MTELTTTTQGIAKDEKTGLTLPLSKSLGSQDLAKHRAMVAVELEVLAKKYDRYGWERDRGSAAHDRIITDWMNALQDYPLDEVRKACAEAVKDDPKRMPNEGAILKQILKARQKHVQALPKPRENVAPINRPTAQRAAEIIRAAGIQLRGTPQ
jgi:hypothetical protein